MAVASMAMRRSRALVREDTLVGWNCADGRMYRSTSRIGRISDRIAVTENVGNCLTQGDEVLIYIAQVRMRDV